MPVSSRPVNSYLIIRKVAPPFAHANVPDHHIGHSIAARKTSVRRPIDAPNLLHLFVFQFAPIAAFEIAVQVVSGCAEEQMLGIDADLNVTAMTHHHPVWDRSNERFVG